MLSRRHEYSKTRGSRVNGRRSIAPRREWNDRHFMNREPSPIELGARAERGAAAAPGRSTGGAGPAAGSARRFRPRRKWRSDRTWRRARRKCAAYLSGRLRRRHRRGRTAHHTSPHALIPISAKVRAITTLRINYSCCYLKIFVCDAERSQPAARADTELHTRTASPPRGDWWGQAAPAPAEAPTHAHTAARPFPRAARRHRSERDHDNSLSQRRLVNTNRPRSRENIRPSLGRTRARTVIASRRAPHTRAILANCSPPSPPPPPPVCYIWQFFQKTDMHRHRGRGAAARHVATTTPRHTHST